eukprot:jgi/Ulvmu1/9431/UM051_0059.1
MHTACAAAALLLLLASACDADTGRPPPPPRARRGGPMPSGAAENDPGSPAGSAMGTTPSGNADAPLPAPMNPTTLQSETLPPPPPKRAEEGDLRLVARVVVNGFATGALQVFLDGDFGAVCVNTFDPADADVACRQMGFSGGTALPLAAFDFSKRPFEAPEQEVIAPFVLENLDCSGMEARLLDCPGVMEESYPFTQPPYTYGSRSDVRSCRPMEGGYAYVACGMTAGPGLPPWPAAGLYITPSYQFKHRCTCL